MTVHWDNVTDADPTDYFWLFPQTTYLAVIDANVAPLDVESLAVANSQYPAGQTHMYLNTCSGAQGSGAPPTSGNCSYIMPSAQYIGGYVFKLFTSGGHVAESNPVTVGAVQPQPTATPTPLDPTSLPYPEDLCSNTCGGGGPDPNMCVSPPTTPVFWQAWIVKVWPSVSSAQVQCGKEKQVQDTVCPSDGAVFYNHPINTFQVTGHGPEADARGCHVNLVVALNMNDHIRMKTLPSGARVYYVDERNLGNLGLGFGPYAAAFEEVLWIDANAIPQAGRTSADNAELYGPLLTNLEAALAALAEYPDS